MPWYGFLHPALALFTMVYGVRVAQTSVSRLAEWDFPLRRQRTRTVIFFLLCVANLLLGFVVQIFLRAQAREVKLTLHVPFAAIVVVFSVLASLVSFSRPRQPGEVPELMRLHPWILILAIVVMMTMTIIALLALFGV